jgi:hypothetical protein
VRTGNDALAGTRRLGHVKAAGKLTITRKQAKAARETHRMDISGSDLSAMFYPDNLSAVVASHRDVFVNAWTSKYASAGSTIASIESLRHVIVRFSRAR